MGTLTLESSPAQQVAPTCSSSTLPPTTTRRPSCPSARMEKKLPPSSTRTIRTTTNSMAGQNIIMDVKRGDEIVVYAYTGTWLADFPMNHYTHWVGLLLKPSQEEAEALRKEAYESC